MSVSRKFLAPLEKATDEVKDALARMCVTIHTSVSAMAEDFYEELRRRYYITPKSYLDLIDLYMALLDQKR